MEQRICSCNREMFRFAQHDKRRNRLLRLRLAMMWRGFNRDFSSLRLLESYSSKRRFCHVELVETSHQHKPPNRFLVAPIIGVILLEKTFYFLRHFCTAIAVEKSHLNIYGNNSLGEIFNTSAISNK